MVGRALCGVTNDVTYKVQRTARAKLQIVHRNRLKRYRDDVQFGWWERPVRGAPAKEEPVREGGQGASGSGPQSSPLEPPLPVDEGNRREPVDEAEPERPEQSGGVLGGEDSGATAMEAACRQSNRGVSQKRGHTHDSFGTLGSAPGAILFHTNF